MATPFVQIDNTGRSPAHPWVEVSRFAHSPECVSDGQSLSLVDSDGRFLGCGVLDLGEGRSLW
ncbi:MAG: hypothetical protein R6U56_10780, partial [Opitutales bacterium]